VLTLKLAAATAVAALVALVPGGSASAAYEDPASDVEVSPTTLVGGGSFSGTATSNGVDCSWTISFPGQSDVTGSGTRISFTFDTSSVDEETEEDLTVVCEYDDENIPQAAQAGVVNVQPASYSATATLPTVIQELTRVVTITLLPEGDGDDDDGDGDGDGDGDEDGDDDDNGGLPDTGGTDQTIVLTGLALLAVGTGVVIMARRRNDGTA